MDHKSQNKRKAGGSSSGAEAVASSDKRFRSSTATAAAITSGATAAAASTATARTPDSKTSIACDKTVRVQVWRALLEDAESERTYDLHANEDAGWRKLVCDSNRILFQNGAVEIVQQLENAVATPDLARVVLAYADPGTNLVRELFGGPILGRYLGVSLTVTRGDVTFPLRNERDFKEAISASIALGEKSGQTPVNRFEMKFDMRTIPIAGLCITLQTLKTALRAKTEYDTSPCQRLFNSSETAVRYIHKRREELRKHVDLGLCELELYDESMVNAAVLNFTPDEDHEPVLPFTGHDSLEITPIVLAFSRKVAADGFRCHAADDLRMKEYYTSHHWPNIQVDTQVSLAATLSHIHQRLNTRTAWHKLSAFASCIPWEMSVPL